jgi:hypothetical protein
LGDVKRGLNVVSAADPNQYPRGCESLLGMLYFVVAVCVGLLVLRSPAIRIPSPFELSGVELAATILALAALALSVQVIIEFVNAVRELSGY